MQGYFLCNYATGLAEEYLHVKPKVWRNISGFADLPDAELVNLEWAHWPSRGFVPAAAMATSGVTEESMDAVYNAAQEAQKSVVRAERDKRLMASDSLMLPDRIANFTEEQNAAVVAYREALRTFPDTIEDWFAPVWPVNPIA